MRDISSVSHRESHIAFAKKLNNKSIRISNRIFHRYAYKICVKALAAFYNSSGDKVA